MQITESLAFTSEVDAARQYDVIVIGAGQAGLATGYYLQQQGDLRFCLLDANERVGDVWRKRWESLRLFTPAKYSNLPGYDFPTDDPYHLPTKDDVADYFEEYAAHFDLPIHLETYVTRLTPLEDAQGAAGYRLETSQGVYLAQQVVVATGAYHTPYIPDLAADIRDNIQQMHTTAYNTPDDIDGEHVLVVGAGSSGAQIALDLADTHTVTLSGRDPGSVPRTVLGKDIYWWWYTFGIMDIARDSLLERFVPIADTEGGFRVNVPAERIHDAGIDWVSRIEDTDDGYPQTADGRTLASIDAIIWATGYRPQYDWIDHLPTDERGYPQHERGVVQEMTGLYFVGLPFLYRVNSELVGGVGRDAAYVVEQITQYVPQQAIISH